MSVLNYSLSLFCLFIILKYSSATSLFKLQTNNNDINAVDYRDSLNTQVTINSSNLLAIGGKAPWDAFTFKAVDDRVRGGISQSFLTLTNQNTAIFHGTVDIQTLGGAGFASQRTEISTSISFTHVDIEVILDKINTDSKVYALNLYPSLGKDPNASNIEYKYEFAVRKDLMVANDNNGEEKDSNRVEIRFRIPRASFIPYYRGRPAENQAPLPDKLEAVSIMCASRFGQQQGPFSLEIKSIYFIKEVL